MLPLYLTNKKSPWTKVQGDTPQMPCRPNYNLHKRAGGSPKFCFAASNVRFLAGRPAIRRLISASLIRDVGLMGHEVHKDNTHTAGIVSDLSTHPRGIISLCRRGRKNSWKLIPLLRRQRVKRQNARTHPAAHHRHQWTRKAHRHYRQSRCVE